jgi:hypothetical protein
MSGRSDLRSDFDADRRQRLAKTFPVLVRLLRRCDRAALEEIHGADEQGEGG